MHFKEKLAELAEKNKKRTQDLEDSKQIWIKEVKLLYDQIENWLGEYIEKKQISIDFHNLEYSECDEFYEKTHIMEINLGGGPYVILEPTGINIVGAFGKIDFYMQGHKDERIFLLLVENDENKEARYWEIWKSRKQRERIRLDEESFVKVLDEWLENWSD